MLCLVFGTNLYLFLFVQIPGFMVMQVRYLYEAEGNKKAKDAKAVRSLHSFDSIPFPFLQQNKPYTKINLRQNVPPS